MRKKILTIFTVVLLAMLCACGTENEVPKDVDVVVDTVTEQLEQSENVVTEQQTTEEQITEGQTTEKQTAGEQTTENQTVEREIAEEQTTEKSTMDIYVGTYNDYDNDEPNLKISQNEDGTYHVVISIFRLTTLDDGIGTLTEKGLEFVATDASGNPIEGVITREGNEAVVTFTNSTWELIENGTSYRYVKSNDV